MQLGFGTNNYDGNTTLCMASAVAGYKRSFGSDGPPGAYDDLAKADVILLIGANIADNHPILCQRLLENPGATLIVADPRVTKTAMMADILPAAEAALGYRAAQRHRAHPDPRTAWSIMTTSRGTPPASTNCALTWRSTRRSTSPRSPGLTRDLIEQVGDALRARQGRLHRLDHGRQPLARRARRP